MKYWIIILLSLQAFRAEAQRMDMALAEKLLEKEIVFFTARSDSEKFSALLDKAELQKSNREYNRALTELERADKFAFSEKNTSLLKYEKMLNYFLSDQFSRCAGIGFNSEEAESIKKQKEYFFMRFFSLSETAQWDKCKEELLNYCSTCDSNEIRPIILLPVNYDYIDPEQCRQLSSFIPGLGILKAREPVKASASFLLQAGFAVFTGYVFYSEYYIAGVVSGFFPLMKFHKGGSRLSANLAEEHNEKEKNKLKALYSEQIRKVVHL